MSGSFIDITLRDGTIIPAYVTQPAKGSGPGIVLLHDAAGLDEFVMRSADLYAEEGYVVIAPQLPGHDPQPGGIAADNFAVEGVPARPDAEARSAEPLHELCIVKLGVHLGELWYLTELNDWLTSRGRTRFMLTAPPLRLPGAVGSPVTPIATV